MTPDLIYLDHAATTAPDHAVVAAMMPWLAHPSNAGARHHGYGAAAAGAIQHARAQIAQSINAAPADIIFTSGATEANNLAIAGLAAHLRATDRTHIITSAVEHKSILAPLAALDGFRVDILPVKPCGMVEANAIARAITDQTGFVCVQAVNNETGTIQPIAEIATILKGRDILLHVDAAQALGKILLDIRSLGADSLSICAHKIHGPQGIGALWCRHDALTAQIHGGGQESGMRSGTLPVALCVGFGAACALLADDRARLRDLRAGFLGRIASLGPIINGEAHPDWHVPGILNLRFPGIDSETLVMALPGLAFGLGAACNAGGQRLSHVIHAMTGSEDAARESVRLSFGRDTTAAGLDRAADQIITAITDIRKLQEAA